MNSRLAIVFIDFAMFLVLIALIQINSKSSEDSSELPNIVMIQTIRGNSLSYNGTNFTMQESVELGVEIELDGIKYTDQDYSQPVTIEKSRLGIFILINDSTTPAYVRVFVRSLGKTPSLCLVSGRCPHAQLIFTCSTREGNGSRQTLSKNNGFVAKCTLDS